MNPTAPTDGDTLLTPPPIADAKPDMKALKPYVAEAYREKDVKSLLDETVDW